MELVVEVKLDDYEKLALKEGIGVLAQYCGLVSCGKCILKEFCHFSPEVDSFPNKLLDAVMPLLE